MSRLTALLPIALVVACALPQDNLGTNQAAVQGTLDPANKFAVAFLDENGAVCSGTLLAPNLVLTARHCVADGGGNQGIDCATDTFDAPWPADTYRVTTAEVSDYATAPYHAKKILVPTSNKFCGGDIALVILQENISAAVATPAVPALTAPSASKIVAIGYGATSPSLNDEGKRHRRENVPVLCIPGQASLDCDPVNDHDMTADEIAAGNGLCGGDSGSGAYVMGGAAPVVIGVLSRASDFGTQCTDAVYSRTDKHAAFIVAGAKEAAKAGNYQAPSWAGPSTDDPKTDPPTTGPTNETPGETTDPTTPASQGAQTTTTSGCSATPSAARLGSPPWGALALGLLAFVRRRRDAKTR